MVRKTRRKGGMFKLATKTLQPIGRAAVTLGKEYSKDYMQKKLPKVTEGLYNDPSLAKNPGYIITGNKPMSSPNFQKNYAEDNDKENNENVNPNIMRGGNTKRNKRRNKRKVKTSKKRK